MKRSTAHIGDIHPAGTITAIHPPRGKNRSVRVVFKCSTCSSLSEPSRYSDLKRGTTESCGCLSKKTFYNYHLGKMDKFSPEERTKIFEVAEIEGRAAAAAQCEVSEYLVGFAWVSEGRRLLGTLSKRAKEAIYTSYIKRGLELTAEAFHITRALVLRVYRSIRRIPSIASFPKLPAEPEIPFVVYMLPRLRDTIEGAIDAVSENEWWRRVGEFTRLELPPASRQSAVKSQIRWAYELLSSTPSWQVPKEIRTEAALFMEACERTFAQRKKRRVGFLRRQRLRLSPVTQRSN